MLRLPALARCGFAKVRRLKLSLSLERRERIVLQVRQIPAQQLGDLAGASGSGASGFLASSLFTISTSAAGMSRVDFPNRPRRVVADPLQDSEAGIATETEAAPCTWRTSRCPG